MKRKIIAIMQPTYMPWMGYFSMIDQVDEFVFLDSVQLVGRSWQVRNKIKYNNQEKMLTIPADKSHNRNERIIASTSYAGETWKNGHLEMIKQAYRKSPFYSEVVEFLNRLYSKTYPSIGNLNATFIVEICRRIGIRTPFFFSSEFDISSHKDKLLNYEHPEYRQEGEGFIPYIGIYDLLFNVGFSESLTYIQEGNRENYTCAEYRKEILHK